MPPGGRASSARNAGLNTGTAIIHSGTVGATPTAPQCGTGVTSAALRCVATEEVRG
jgi:broad specificity polyphosphatase/5'/3'-nucleotidase SurE